MKPTTVAPVTTTHAAELLGELEGTIFYVREQLARIAEAAARNRQHPRAGALKLYAAELEELLEVPFTQLRLMRTTEIGGVELELAPLQFVSSDMPTHRRLGSITAARMPPESRWTCEKCGAVIYAGEDRAALDHAMKAHGCGFRQALAAATSNGSRVSQHIAGKVAELRQVAAGDAWGAEARPAEGAAAICGAPTPSGARCRRRPDHQGTAHTSIGDVARSMDAACDGGSDDAR